MINQKKINILGKEKLWNPEGVSKLTTEDTE